MCIGETKNDRFTVLNGILGEKTPRSGENFAHFGQFSRPKGENGVGAAKNRGGRPCAIFDAKVWRKLVSERAGLFLHAKLVTVYHMFMHTHAVKALFSTSFLSLQRKLRGATN